MILHRFCSEEELTKYLSGITLVNTTDHAANGCRTTSKGFCFFSQDPEKAIHWLSGIVDMDWLVTFEIKERFVKRSKGNYEIDGKPKLITEYCSMSYDRSTFRFVRASRKYRTYAPAKRDASKWVDMIVSAMAGRTADMQRLKYAVKMLENLQEEAQHKNDDWDGKDVTAATLDNNMIKYIGI